MVLHPMPTLFIQVHPATMLGWYDYDRNKNNGHIVHFPIVIKAYFKCIENQVRSSLYGTSEMYYDKITQFSKTSSSFNGELFLISSITYDTILMHKRQSFPFFSCRGNVSWTHSWTTWKLMRNLTLPRVRPTTMKSRGKHSRAPSNTLFTPTPNTLRMMYTGWL